MKISNVSIAILLYVAGASAAPINTTAVSETQNKKLRHHDPSQPPPPPPGPPGPGGLHFASSSNSTLNKRLTDNNTTLEKKGFLGGLFGHHHNEPAPPAPQPQPQPGHGGPGGPGGHFISSSNSTLATNSTLEKRASGNSTLEEKGFLGGLFGHHHSEPAPPQPQPQPGHGGQSGPGGRHLANTTNSDIEKRDPGWFHHKPKPEPKPQPKPQPQPGPHH